MQETPAHDARGPAAPAARNEALDALRGAAVLGILLINITAMGMPWQSGELPSVYGGATGVNFWSWALSHTLIEGAMRAIFAALFGAGFLLLLERLEARAPGLRSAEIYGRRLLALAGFGLIDAYLLFWPGDILYTYAILGFFLLPLRGLKPGWLIGLALALILLRALDDYGYFLLMAEAKDAAELAAELVEIGETPTPAQEAAAGPWREHVSEYAPSGEALARQLAAPRAGYGALFAPNAELVGEVQQEFTWSGLLPDFDVFSMMLLGMAAMRLGWLGAGAPALRLLVIGYGIGLPISLYETWSLAASGFDPLEALRLKLSYDLGRIGMAAGHAGALLLLFRSRLARPVLGALARVGRMALTNYLLQSVFALFLFTGAGLALYGRLQRWELYFVAVAIWGVLLAFSALWLKRFRYGPVEWAWRAVSYGEAPRLRLGDTAQTQP